MSLLPELVSDCRLCTLTSTYAIPQPIKTVHGLVKGEGSTFIARFGEYVFHGIFNGAVEHFVCSDATLGYSNGEQFTSEEIETFSAVESFVGKRTINIELHDKSGAFDFATITGPLEWKISKRYMVSGSGQWRVETNEKKDET